jgi:hypothetical protein
VVTQAVGLEVNSEKLKYMLMLCYQKEGQKHSIKILNRSFEDVAKFEYLGITLTDQNCMHEEIKSRLNSGNACYCLVQSHLSSYLLSGNVKGKIYKSLILPVVLFRSETWSVTLREEHRLRVLESTVLRRIFGPKRDEAMGEWRECTTGSFIICTYLHVAHMEEVRKRTRFWWEGL